MPPLADYLAAARLRPGMYVGSVDFFGLFHYMASAVDLMLVNGATWLEIAPTRARFRVSSNARLAARLNKMGQTFLERVDAEGNPDLNGIILAGLSAGFAADVDDGRRRLVVKFRRGQRHSLTEAESARSGPRVQLDFSPDASIFTATRLSPSVLECYCRRSAYLHPDTEFRLRIGRRASVFHFREGIRDLFQVAALPLQILHEPIYLTTDDDELRMEVVMAFHRWPEHRIVSFLNEDYVPKGGTHEDGLLDGVNRVLAGRQLATWAGLVAVLMIEYPRTTYAGSVKARVINPELRMRIASLVEKGLTSWIQQRPDEFELLKLLERSR